MNRARRRLTSVIEPITMSERRIPQKAQLDPLGVLCVKFEDNRTFRDMLRKRIVYGRPNGPTP